VVLTDEAVFHAARFVVPGVTVFWPQIDTCLMSINIVRLGIRRGTLEPVGVAHGLVSEFKASRLFVVIRQFPHKL